MNLKLNDFILKELNFNINDVSIFELGKKYEFKEDKPQETNLLSGACTGSVLDTRWQKKKEIIDFFYVKGILEKVFEKLDVLNQISFVQELSPEKDFHPMRSAKIVFNNAEIGMIAQVHPNVQKEYDINDTFVFEVNIDPILEHEVEEFKTKSISKYPTMTRDIAIVVDETIKAQEIVEAIISKGKNILKTVDVFDVYKGEHVEKLKKSIAFSLIFENVDKTLTDDEVNLAYDRIVKHLEVSFQAILRK